MERKALLLLVLGLWLQSLTASRGGVAAADGMFVLKLLSTCRPRQRPLPHNLRMGRRKLKGAADAPQGLRRATRMGSRRSKEGICLISRCSGS